MTKFARGAYEILKKVYFCNILLLLEPELLTHALRGKISDQDNGTHSEYRSYIIVTDDHVLRTFEKVTYNYIIPE